MTITLQDVENTMQALLAEEDRRNPQMVVGTISTCVYTDKRGCHCFAGEILTRLGALVPSHGHMNNVSNLHDLQEQEDWDFGVTINEDAFKLLKATQYYADNDYTWHGVVTSYLDGQISLEDPFYE